MAQQLKISQILEDLNNGLTRTKANRAYNPEIGCIQDKYDLSSFEMETLFAHPKLKGRKTKQRKQVTFTLIDDVNEDGDVQDIAVTNTENVVNDAQEVEQVIETPSEEVIETPADNDGW